MEELTNAEQKQEGAKPGQYKVLIEKTPTSRLLEQYKLYVQMADNVSDRRLRANEFYTTLLTGLFALLAIVVGKDLFASAERSFILSGVGLLGILLCMLWVMQIASYRQLNAGKFQVIHDMEKGIGLEEGLPFHCYAYEWDILKKGMDRKTYWPFTHVERFIPALFSIPYIMLLIVGILSFFHG